MPGMTTLAFSEAKENNRYYIQYCSCDFNSFVDITYMPPRTIQRSTFWIIVAIMKCRIKKSRFGTKIMHPLQVIPYTFRYVFSWLTPIFRKFQNLSFPKRFWSGIQLLTDWKMDPR